MQQPFCKTKLLGLLILFGIGPHPTQAAQPPCEMILNSSHVYWDVKSLRTVENWVIQVNDPRGDWIANFEIPFKEDEPLLNLKASLELPSGKVLSKLKKKDITYKSRFSSVSFYDDYKLAAFSLRHNEYPYRIRVSFEQVEHNYLFLSRWSPLYPYNILVREAELILETPAQEKISLWTQDIEDPSINTIGSITTYRFIARDVRRVYRETHSPPFGEIAPLARVIPTRFHYGGDGSFADWKSFGEWQLQLNSGLQALPESEIVKIHNLTDPIEHPRDKVKALYYYLQDETRYVSISTEIGGLKPYPARYVCEKKYGDCKALSNYMAAMLQEIGIESYYVKIFGGEIRRKVNPAFPCPQSNHAILCVPIDGDTLWLENTSQVTPFGYVGSFIQDRYAMLVKPGDSQLVRMPALTDQSVICSRYLTINLQADESFPVSLSATYRGDDFETLRYLEAAATERRKDQWLQNRYPIAASDIKTQTLSSPHRDSTYIQWNSTALLPSWGKKYGNLRIIPLPLLHAKGDFIKERRYYPIRIPYPTLLVDTLEFQVDPSLYQEARLPTDINLDSPYGKYQLTASFNSDNGVLTIYRTWHMYAGEYPAEAYDAFYTFLQQVDELEASATFTLK